MRGIALLAFFAVALLGSSPALAQFGGLDQSGVRLPISHTPFAVLRNVSPRNRGDFYSGIRAGHTSAPLAVRRPSTEKAGTVAAVVDRATSIEMAASVGLGMGLEAGLGWGAHLSQTGAGVEVATEQETRLIPFGAHDPRFELAWATEGELFSFRPFIMAQFPLGRPEAFVGESTARAAIGATLGKDARNVRWAAEISFLHRRTVDLGSSTWGPQLRFSAGALFRLTKQLSVGPEMRLSPVVSSQRGNSGQKSSHLIPAEALGTLSYRFERLQLGLSSGTGLPFTRTSRAHSERKWVRGPTSPVFRALLDVRVTLD